MTGSVNEKLGPLQALRVPVVQLGASAAISASGRASPAIATALAVLGNERTLRSSRLWVDDGGLGLSGLADGGGRGGGSSGSSEASGGDSTAVVDHGGGAGAVLNGVASWEGSEGSSTLNTLVDDGLDSARVHVGIRLLDEGTAGVGETKGVEALVHSTLQSVTLPTEDVVTVLSVTGGVTHGKDEGLAAISGPWQVVERLGVPNGLEEEQRHAGGVGRRAVSVHQDDTSIVVNTSLEESHVARVVGRVEVLPVPARREEDVGTDTSRALLVGEVDGVISANTGGRAVRGVGESGSLPATEAEGVSLRTCLVDSLPLADHGVTGDHTETLGEGGDLRATGRLDVVDGHTTVGRTSKVVGDLRNTSEGSVLVPEVHDGSPVVGLVLLELATRAGRHLGDVVVEVHGDIESVTTDDLVDVSGHLARVDQGVSALRH
jgi:hypothetical protein